MKQGPQSSKIPILPTPSSTMLVRTSPPPYPLKSILSPLIASNFALFPPTISTHTNTTSQPKTTHWTGPRSAIPNQHSHKPAICSPFKSQNPLTINDPGRQTNRSFHQPKPGPLPTSNARTGSGRPFDPLPLDGSQWVMRGFPEILSRAARLR